MGLSRKDGFGKGVVGWAPNFVVRFLSVGVSNPAEKVLIKVFVCVGVNNRGRSHSESDKSKTQIDTAPLRDSLRIRHGEVVEVN